LRQKIKEIGAAVIRAASSSIEATSEEDVEKSGLTEDTISQKPRRDETVTASN